MKRLTLALAVMFMALSAWAELPANHREKASPTDATFMEMALDAAKISLERGQGPNGAIIVLNGAWRSTGMPEFDQTAEINAASKTRRPNLKGCTIYTVNQPTTETYNELCRQGAKAVIFANPAVEVVAAGIYSEADYADAPLEEGVAKAPMRYIEFAPAADFLNVWNK